MPYKVKKQGDQYVVYKKDTGKRVGATAGNKQALRKYMAALHINAKEGVLNEDAASDLEKWSQTPLKAMGAGDPTAKLSDLAKDLVKKGSEDGSPTDDKNISPAGGAGSIGLMQLKASQNEVGKSQSLTNVLKGVNANDYDGINWGDVDWLVDHMKPGAEITFKSAILGAKTKDGNVVLDGHHRWSQAFMLNPLAKVNVAFADASGKTADQTLKAVHLAILAKTGQSKTKEAKGGNLFNGASTGEILNLFKAAPKVDPKTGKPSDTGVAPYVAAVMRFEDISDVKEGTAKAIQRVKFAIEACAKTVVGGAPSRDAMPQADGELNAIDAKAALAALDSGDINYNTPFVKESMLRKAIRKAVLQEVKRLKKK